MSPQPARRWSLPVLSLLAVLAVVAVTSPSVVASGAVFDSQISTTGSGDVHCVTTLVSGPEGPYRHYVKVQLATGGSVTLSEDRTYLVGHVEVSNLQAPGTVSGFIKETFDPLF